MTPEEDRNLIEALKAAGAVPPPPDREGAYARAMAAVGAPPRRLNRGVTLLIAAALLAIPSTVVAMRGQPPSRIGTPTTVRPTAKATPPRDATSVSDEQAAQNAGRGNDEGSSDDDDSGPGSDHRGDSDDDDGSGDEGSGDQGSGDEGSGGDDDEADLDDDGGSSGSDRERDDEVSDSGDDEPDDDEPDQDDD
jgi:hypothetical protein